jgi:hypothetical protein
MVAPAYNPSYSDGGDLEDFSSRQAHKKNKTLSQKHPTRKGLEE